MRTVICHFYNEAYLLPWWLEHHKKIFDYGIMINHGSTDKSLDIIREIVPHWRVVNTTLMNFNAYMTDFEVMKYENELPGWKIALNVTEFLLSSVDLADVEKMLVDNNLDGVSCTGYVLVDPIKGTNPNTNIPLVKQLYWGFNENSDIRSDILKAIQGDGRPNRNRFFHRLPVGMYHPGRHYSFHPDSKIRTRDMMIFHFGWAPWNEHLLRRKVGIKTRLDQKDILRGWGLQHIRSEEQLLEARELALKISYDLSSEEAVRLALERL